MSEVLKRARDYEKRAGAESHFERPQFHVTPQIGWMNDPNGFSVFQGEYHLFYQYYPYKTEWGAMHWGHVKTKDFICWENMPCAIAPDTEYDAQGCFSGSALQWKEKHVLVYTGITDKVENQKHIIRQTQCVAIGDGVNYEKIQNNPVITGDQLPKGGSVEDFRDPKVYAYGNDFYMVVGNRAKDGSGQILFYRTRDFENWEFISVVDQSKNEIGKMWECPDYFSLGDKQVLLFSPQEMSADDEFHNGNCAVGMVGHFDNEKKCFVRESVQSLDYGLDFYAPQTLQANDGRRIMIGWLQSWDNNFYPGESEWSGMMSIPRELCIREGRICQNPVRELANYYSDTVTYQQTLISGVQEFAGIYGRKFDMELELSGKDYDVFTVKVGVGEGRETSLIYNRHKGYIEMDRTRCGITRDIITTRKQKVTSKEDKLKIRMLLDNYSMEVFLNNGETVMSMLFFTPLEADRILFEADGKAIADISYHKIAMES
jgi:beta-fructofuranosidase